jgi:hypothetical protein
MLSVFTSGFYNNTSVMPVGHGLDPRQPDNAGSAIALRMPGH